MGTAVKISRFQLLTATTPATQAELFVEICWELGTLGMRQWDEGDEVAFEAYFPPETPRSRLLSEFSAAAGRLGLRVLELKVAAVQDRPEEWLDNWKSGFHGFDVGASLFVHPGWEPPSARHPVNILMEPGHAFGTGTHESTRLCLRALPETAPLGGRFMDVGTGSGILAIAMLKLRPEAKVFAIDNDPLAVEMADENFRRNEISPAGLAVAAPGAIRGAFDFVAANLTLAIFRREVDEIARLAGGALLVSGFTAEQSPAVADLFRRGGLEAIASWSLNGWDCLLLSRSSASGSSVGR